MSVPSLAHAETMLRQIDGAPTAIARRDARIAELEAALRLVVVSSEGTPNATLATLGELARVVLEV